MDILSHGLWGGVALGMKKRSDFIMAFILSVLPDVFAEGVMFLLVYLGVSNMPNMEHGHPKYYRVPYVCSEFL